MGQYLDLKILNEEIMILLKKYKLKPKVLSLRLVLPADHFETVALDHPDRKHPAIIQASQTDSQLQWGITITRKMKLEDFPPGTILTLPLE